MGRETRGEKIIRELIENVRLNAKVIGFIDDDKLKWGRSIHGIQVLGGVNNLSGIKQKYDIQEDSDSSPIRHRAADAQNC